MSPSSPHSVAVPASTAEAEAEVVRQAADLLAAEEHERRRRVIIVIDEAHLLSSE